MAGNDNGRVSDLSKVAVLATRCLELLVAPDERIRWGLAWERWRIVEASIQEIWTNEQATVEQVVTAGHVVCGWYRYWSKFHPRAGQRTRCLTAWLDTNDVLEEHRRQSNDPVC
jgi:hypothetical protein